MPITCKTCGAENSHLTHKCPQSALRNPLYAPLVREVDPAWANTARDLTDPDYVAWLAGPHDLVIKELANLEHACERLGRDIELEGAAKELMHAGWLHGPYVHDPEAPRAKWKKWTLKIQVQGDGRVSFQRDRMAIHFEDVTGQLRTLNARNFFTKMTPEDNQLKHVINAVRGSPEWKGRPRPCRLTCEELAKRVLEIFPEVEYRREGDIKIFVGARGKRQRDDAVYTFIEEELRSGVAEEISCSAPENAALASNVSTRFEGTSSTGHCGVHPRALPQSLERAVSDAESDAGTLCIVAVLRMGSPLEVFRRLLLESEFAAEARAEGVEIEPEWAQGAKIFVRISAEDLGSEIDLRSYHVVIHEVDVPRVHEILRTLSCKQRPLVKSTCILPLRQDPQPQEPEAEVVPNITIEKTFIHVPEKPWITPRSKYTHSCNDMHAGHMNPRSRMCSLHEDFTELKACQKALDLPGAISCYSKIVSKCVTPSVHIFTILIDICGKTGANEDAERWMEVMIHEHGIKPSCVTFNCLINGFAKVGNPAGAEKWFNAMLKEAMNPEMCSYKSMIRALTFKGCELGMVYEAESWFQKAKSTFGTLDVATYQIMMDAYARNGLADKVESYFVDMESCDFSCDREAFNSVISAYANAKDLDGARAWCSKAEKAGFVPAVREYTMLLKACGPKPDQPANPIEGRSIFLHQVAAGIAPDHDNLQALADALGKTASRRLCEELHVHTRAANLSWWPDPRHFSKPLRLARQALGLSSGSSATHAES